MQISVLGIDHRADAAIREKAAFSESHSLEFSSRLLASGAAEAVILSTCNRSEIYYLQDTDDELKLSRTNRDFRRLYIDYFKLADHQSMVYQLSGEQAIRHIFRVAAGLESAVIGEDEILRQVKEAYEFAHNFHNTDKYFNRLFQEAIKCAKEIKTSLKISEIPVSTGYIGLKYLEKESGSFEGKTMLLLGFGEIGKLFLQYAKDRPLAKIIICNRSADAAKAACQELNNVEYQPSSRAAELVSEADLLVAATSCPHVLLKKQDMPPRETPCYMLDMAIPRNIDETIAELPNYHVANIDVLKQQAAAGMAERDALSARAEAVIEQYLADYKAWVAHSGQDNVIQSLNNSVDEIAEAHLKYLFRKIAVSEREQKIISRTLQSALRKAVQNPILSLKAIDDPQKREHYSQVLQELFENEQRQAR